MRPGASYVIDRAAPLRPPAAQVQAWAEDKRVFASSVIPGLKECRDHAKAAITKVGALAVMFETFGGKEDPPDIAYLSEVGRSDIYVGILDIPYGRVQENGISATHDEYREAERIGLPISVWVTTSAKDERQQALVEEVRELHTTGSYSTLYELERGIETRLVEMASEELSPWVKVGKAIFRASTVLETSGRVVIEVWSETTISLQNCARYESGFLTLAADRSQYRTVGEPSVRLLRTSRRRPGQE